MFDSLSVLLVIGIVAASLVLYLSRCEPDVHPALLRFQTSVSTTRFKGESAVYRNRQSPNGTPLQSSLSGVPDTVYHALWERIQKHGSARFLGTRLEESDDYSWLSYSTIGEQITQFGSALLSLSLLAPFKNDVQPANLVGILLSNSVEWSISDFACMSYGLVSVPLHEAFDSQSLLFVLAHCQLRVLITSFKSLDRLWLLLPQSKIKVIVLADLSAVDAETENRAKTIRVSILSFSSLLQKGKKALREPVAPHKDQVFTISYTSGSTDAPKGVMLSLSNVTAAIAGIVAVLPQTVKPSPSSTVFSYLPLSHCLERDMFYTAVFFGSAVGFCGSASDSFMLDVALVKPTLFPAVPRLLLRLQNSIITAVSTLNPLAKAMFHLAYSAKLALLLRGVVSRDTWWDWLVFRKIQGRLGGNVRAILTGAAPINPSVLQFLRVVFGCDVFEGYGLTETCAAGLVTVSGDYSAPFGAFVGVPFTSCEYKLVDVGGMGYLASDSDPRGEICIRGPTVMRGYYKDPVKTKETIDPDGWLHTGDIGQVLPNGTLKIIDRIKNVFKLAQGEFVAPEKVESKLLLDCFSQLFVYGDSMQTCLVAVGFVQPDKVLQWAKTFHLDTSSFDSFEALIQSDLVVKKVLAEMAVAAKKQGLAGFEIPKGIHLSAELMTVENGLLTPTMKARRKQVAQRFSSQIEKIYKSLA